MNAAQPSMIEMMLPFVFVLGIFYFLIMRPQSKKLKEQDSFIKSLKRGDAVITNSGILGTVDGLTDTIVTLEVGPNTKIKMLRKQIAGSQAIFNANNEKAAAKAAAKTSTTK